MQGDVIIDNQTTCTTMFVVCLAHLHMYYAALDYSTVYILYLILYNVQSKSQ